MKKSLFSSPQNQEIKDNFYLKSKINDAPEQQREDILNLKIDDEDPDSEIEEMKEPEKKKVLREAQSYKLKDYDEIKVEDSNHFNYNQNPLNNKILKFKVIMKPSQKENNTNTRVKTSRG